MIVALLFFPIFILLPSIKIDSSKFIALYPDLLPKTLDKNLITSKRTLVDQGLPFILVYNQNEAILNNEYCKRNQIAISILQNSGSGLNLFFKDFSLPGTLRSPKERTPT